MNKISSILTWVNILLTAGIIFLLCLDRCQPAVPATETIHTETLKIYDSTKKNITVKTAPGTVSFYPVAMPSKLDTAAIGAALRNYFSSFTYTQTIQDSALRATIFDSVSQNRIMNRRFAYNFLKPVKTIESTTITLPAKQNTEVFIGGFTDFNKGYFGIGPKISVITKKDVCFGYDFDVKNSTHRVSLQAKLKWK